MNLRHFITSQTLIAGIAMTSVFTHAFDLGNLSSTLTQAIDPPAQNSSPIEQFMGKLGQDRQQPLSTADRLGVTAAVDTAKSALQTTHGAFLDKLSHGLNMDRNTLSSLIPNNSAPIAENVLLSTLTAKSGHSYSGESMNLLRSALGQRNDAIGSIKSDLVRKLIELLGGNLNSGMVTALLPIIGL